MSESEVKSEASQLRRFTWIVAVVSGVLAVIPWIIAKLTAPSGSTYLGYEFYTDDHMVYAAWMRQAMDGHFLFDNRFTTAQQPGLTINLFFLVLGWIAKVFGIATTTMLARVALSVAFVHLVGRLLRRLELEELAYKVALVLTVVGGGIGFLVWHNFGNAIVLPAPDALSQLLLQRLPNDVWQPEGFVFPSMLTNALFMVSLCLILVVLNAVLEARSSAKAVVPGELAMLALMNIHSYDVLLVSLVLVGLLVAALASKRLERAWVLRSVAIGLGAVPAALWFVYVLRNDPVFQARAVTETYSPNFRQVLFGYLPLLLLGCVGLVVGRLEGPKRNQRLAGLGLFVLAVLALTVAAQNHTQRYFLDMPMWVMLMAVGGGCVWLLSDDNPAYNLVLSWAILGLFAIYFPALFQRKLTMGLSIPWALLAGFGLVRALKAQPRSTQVLASSLVLLVCGATSLRWLSRELFLIKSNVSNTTVHAVYLTADMQRIVDTLNGIPGRKVVIAPPGIPSPLADNDGKALPDQFGTPVVTDLNPILAGLTGCYAYAGHWSETPNYLNARAKVTAIYNAKTLPEDRAGLLREIGAQYVVSPHGETAKQLGFGDTTSLGEVIYAGKDLSLVRVSNDLANKPYTSGSQ